MASLKQLRDPDFEVYGPGEDLYMGDVGPYQGGTPSPFQEQYEWGPETPTKETGTQVKPPKTRPYFGAGGTPSRTTTTTQRPTRPMPEVPTIPAFTPPEWDESKIRKAAQRKAAPRLRSLRRQMEREAGRQYENPNVKRMTLRQAMEGYGLGVGSIMSEAETAGRAEYGQEYGREFAGAQTTYAAQTQALMQSYNNAFNAYLQSMQQVTTTGPTPAAEGETEIGGEHWSISPTGPVPWGRAPKNPFGYPTGGA